VTRRRLDAELVRRGLVEDPARARAVVGAGLVSVGGIPTSNAASMVRDDEALVVATPGERLVSRAGAKLEAALDRFGIEVAGRECLDAGAATGGFTEVLLRAGARRVAAVDVAYGELAWRLRNDPRVLVLERTNVRDLTPRMLGFTPTIVAADLSFVSLRTVLPYLLVVAGPAADLVVLVKPQFEVPGRDVGAGGVVRDPGLWRRALSEVAEAATGWGAPPIAVLASPLPGSAGNVEFPMHLRRGAPGATADLEAALAEGERVRDR
jgi:23S rRNA (cytidine1920-2'-O)/16S rRNA (cytidine1409-2'-O)-methyltransferase